MINYLKLVHFEVKRFWKLYAGLALVIALGQLTIVLYEANRFAAVIEKMRMTGKSFETILDNNGLMLLTNLTNSPFYMFTVMFGVIVLVIYMFFIWYRDWFGKNTFVYRLLMLPTNRMNLFFAKATTIFLLIFGLVALQILLLAAEQGLINLIVPKDFVRDMGINNILADGIIGIMIPDNFTHFLINYGLGFAALVTVFTAILLERSFRVKGIVLAIVYGILAFLVMSLPLFIQDFTGGYFYIKELVIMEILCGAFVVIAGMLISKYLLNNKITV